MSLSVAFRGEFHAMVWDHLVNLAVLIPFGLGMADEDYHLMVSRLDGVGALNLPEAFPWLRWTDSIIGYSV